MPDADLLPYPLHVTSCDFTIVVSETVVPLELAVDEIDATLGEIDTVSLVLSLPDVQLYVIT